MTGIEISKKTPLSLFYLSASCAIFSIAFGIAYGPIAITLLSGLGLALGIVDALKRTWRRESVTLPSIMIGVHVLFLIIAAVLAFFFLAPLPEASLNMPKLGQRHTDLNGRFQVRLPDGWQLTPLSSEHEIGVRAHPADRNEYMGVAELTVRVRILDNKQHASENFFKKIAATMSLSGQQRKRAYEFFTSSATLLNKQPGLWSHLVLKRFWIPLYQTSLFGLQNDRYLCSVATSGIKSHDKLAEVLCLGVMESIQITEKR
jgi:hypothetical protein